MSAKLACFLLCVPLWLSAQRMASTYPTLQSFLDTCPQNDPYMPVIQRDFQITRDGGPANAIVCTEPYSKMPVAQITEELSTIQTLRFAYYMDMGQSEYLPWTPFRLYGWMKSRIAGINIDSKLVGAAGGCCIYVNGRQYIDIGTITNDLNRQYRQRPDGQAAQLLFFAHEIRHSEGTHYGHVSACGIAFGCDQTYDETNLSPYAIQYYLAKQMMTGAINLGYSCDPATAVTLGTAFEQLANVYPSRFDTNPPPMLTLPANPGGACIPATTFTLSTNPFLTNAYSGITILALPSIPNAGWTADSVDPNVVPVSGFSTTGAGSATFISAPSSVARTLTVVAAGNAFSVNQTACTSFCGTPPSITSVASGAPFVSTITAGSWVSIYGANLSTTTRLWQGSDFVGDKLPLSLDGVSVRIDGLPAAVYYISPTQINVQAPDNGAVGPLPVTVQVVNSFGIGSATAAFASTAPAFFAFGPGARYVAAVHLDGTYVAPAGLFGTSVVSRPAAPGETVILFGTGFGPTDPPTGSGVILKIAPPLATPAELKIGGETATVLFGGLSSPGLYQFNVVIPSVADGDQPLTGASSTLSIAIHR